MGPHRVSSIRLRHRQTQRPENGTLRGKLYDIIFESNTGPGKWFDIVLLLAIVTSITIVSLETVPEYRDQPPLIATFIAIEWFLTILFTIEYALRLYCVRNPLRYATSFWGIIDLLSILPSYLTLLFGKTAMSFVILRSIRLLRVFRVLKLWRMMSEAEELSEAIWSARNKIVVFLAVVLVAVTISGTLMYHIETVTPDGIDETSDFTSIPQSMYWAIVTMATVGYGDIVPHSRAGQVITAILVLLGYSLIIVPSTFISAEFLNRREEDPKFRCPHCEVRGQRLDATFCYRCGKPLED